ncbi:MAG TPA: cytochrome c [Steroidobacteraceae bacterium]|nr:cytochrome c [Steroidobacteraceae bacterium]
MSKRGLLPLAFPILTSLAGAGALGQQPTAAQPTPSAPVQLPDGDGKALVEHACSQCHSLETVTRSHLTRKQWAGRIDQMIAKGAKLSDDDIDVVADYLAKHFGPG